MAGLGTRFQKVSDQNPEYKKPKPFISIKGKPMVRWALASLPALRHHTEEKKEWHRAEPQDVIFIILKEHNDEHEIERKLKEIYSPAVHIIVLPQPTRGAAETAYAAREYVGPDEDIVITDSDHYFNGQVFMETINNRHAETAGIIPVFVARNEGIPKWSYTLVKPGTNDIEKVAEKDRELMERGAYANIGAYYFSKAKIFFDEAEEVIRNNTLTGDEGKKEFYIAPLYQNLIEKGFTFEAAVVPEMWGLGTPSDVDFFLEHCDDDFV